ncbi:MAG: hypothetical protein WDZ58_07685 [Gemmatimonadaceae bacterium]
MIASNETFVTAAYALTWVVLLGYLWRLYSRDARARRDDARVRLEGSR